EAGISVLVNQGNELLDCRNFRRWLITVPFEIPALPENSPPTRVRTYVAFAKGCSCFSPGAPRHTGRTSKSSTLWPKTRKPRSSFGRMWGGGLRRSTKPPNAFLTRAASSSLSATESRLLTNVRDFPVPMRHRSVRIELRNRSFRKGKSHDCSFYAWNRLGKKHLLRARRRRAGRGDGAPYGLTSQAR